VGVGERENGGKEDAGRRTHLSTEASAKVEDARKKKEWENGVRKSKLAMEIEG